MNGDKEKDFPLAFYTGLNFLGRPTSVSVQGESPTAQAAGATPAGALGVGPTGAGGPASATPSGAAGSPDTSAATALQALDLTQNVSSAASKLGWTTTLPTAAELAARDAAMGPQPILDVGGSEVLGAPSAAEGATGTATEAASAGAGIEGAAAIIPVVLSALQLAGVPIPKPITAPQQFGYTGEITSGINAAMNPSWANAARFGEAFATYGLSEVGRALFGGHPRSFAFGSQWQQIKGQVAPQIPSPLPLPKTATPEQRQAIEDANAKIAELMDYIGPDAGAPAGGTSKSGLYQPGFLGTQSAETWNNALESLKTYLQQSFEELGPLYQKALEASQPPTATPTPSSQVLPAGFFSGEHKLPEAA